MFQGIQGQLGNHNQRCHATGGSGVRCGANVGAQLYHTIAPTNTCYHKLHARLIALVTQGSALRP